MGRHRKIDLRMWGDEKFRALSSPSPSGKWLWTYLISGPQTTIIPGLFVTGEAALAEALGWSLVAFRRCWKEIAGQSMAVADWSSRVVWIPRSIRYNEPESPNVIRSWRRTFDEIPECRLKREALGVLRSHVEGMGKGFAKAFQETFPEAYPEGLPEGFPEALPKPSPNQEQEQEQENPLTPPAGAGEVCAVVLSAWNGRAEDPLKPVQNLSRSQTRQIKARAREPGFLDAWPDVCQRIAGSRFCRGDGPNGWVASLHWALKEGVWQRVIAGEFDAHCGQGPLDRPRPPEERAATLRKRIAHLERMAQALGYDPPDLAEARAALAELERNGAA